MWLLCQNLSQEKSQSKLISFVQEEQERPESSSRKDVETGDGEDIDDEGETKEEGGSDKKQPRAESRGLLTPTQTVRC